MNTVNNSLSWDAMLRWLSLKLTEGRCAARNAVLESFAVTDTWTKCKRRKKMRRFYSITSYFPLPVSATVVQSWAGQ
jgi:hypothetical protein